MSTHSSHSQKLRPFTCYFCNKLIDNDTELGHTSTCGAVLEPCYYKCGSYVPRNMRSRHLKECKNRLTKSMTRLSSDGGGADYKQFKNDHSILDTAPKSSTLTKLYGLEQHCQQLSVTLNGLQAKQYDTLQTHNSTKMHFKMQYDNLQYQIKILLEQRRNVEIQMEHVKNEIETFTKFKNETGKKVDNLNSLKIAIDQIFADLKALQVDFQNEQMKNLGSMSDFQRSLNEFKDYYTQENAAIAALWNDYNTAIQQIKNDVAVINKTLDENKAKNSSITFDLRTASQVSAETSDKLEIQERLLAGLRNEVAQLKVDVEALDEKAVAASCRPNDAPGSLLWKISNFSQKMERAKENDTVLKSAIFYTHTYGYKIRLHLYLNGIKKWKGRHMIACFHVLKGEYDLLLRWPCFIEGNLILKDLYNSKNPTNYSKYICAKRFLGDEDNEAPQESSTQYMFVPHSTLMKQNFIKDDTLFIEIKIKPFKEHSETDL